MRLAMLIEACRAGAPNTVITATHTQIIIWRSIAKRADLKPQFP